MPLFKRCNVIINCLSVDKSNIRYKGRIRLKPIFHGNKYQPMHQSMSKNKLTLQASRNYCKRRKNDNAKKTYICIVAEEITKLEIAL